MTLTLLRIVHHNEKHVSVKDQRRRVNYVLAAYRGEDGHEYRKGFESYGEPVVPESGTHDSLNAMKRQWE
jgi:hypothetical protein